MRKMKSKKGFTLIEMLIVVGIIAVLVAVSIPMVNSSLEKAKDATDAANERAAKAAVMVDYLSNNTKIETGMKYNAEDGTIVAKDKTVIGYGRCADHKGGWIEVESFTDGKLTLKWAGTDVKDGVHGLDPDAEITAAGAGA